MFMMRGRRGVRGVGLRGERKGGLRLRVFLRERRADCLIGSVLPLG